MEFTKNTTQGAWINKKELKTGDLLKLVSEAAEIPSQQGGTQVVAKAKVKGHEGDPKNLSINNPSKNALIDAFGKDSKNWMDKLLTVNIEKTVIAGKRGIALYLVPEGFELTEDDSGYLVIVNPNAEKLEDAKVEYPSDEIDPKDIPF